MAKLRRLNEIADAEAQSLIRSVDAVLFDVDEGDLTKGNSLGVLLLDKAVIAGADSLIGKLRSLGKQIGFVTNNSAYSVEKLQTNLNVFGAKPEEIINPTISLLEYLRQTGFKKDIYVVSTVLPKQLLRNAGYNVIEFKDIQEGDMEPSLAAIIKSYVKTLEICQNVGLVYVDFDHNVRYGDVMSALSIMKNIEGVQLLSGMNDDELPGSDGATVIGAQFYIDTVERLSGTKAIQMGKPGAALGDLIVSKFKLSQGSRVLMVGDNVYLDIAFGINSGFKTLLVLSGVSKEAQVDHWDAAEELKADFVAKDVGQLYEKIRNM